MLVPKISQTMITENFQTAIADVSVEEDKIVRVTYFPELLSLEEAQIHKKQLEDKYKDQLPLLILSDIRQMKKASKQVRDYFASTEMASICKARAVVVGSGLSRVIGNFFINFSRPKNPTKIYSNKDKALTWLASLK